ncbi:MAG: hypothetical protein PHQ23_00970 [Candidatus Wallbacteria bacterium]|nr:hypothetical protein [Candidatus Wallbacteria bacterium]
MNMILILYIWNGRKMGLTELEKFLKSISDVLASVEIELRGRLFPEKLIVMEGAKNLRKIEFPHLVGEMGNVPLEIDFSLYSDTGDKRQELENLQRYFSPYLKIFFKLTRTPVVFLMYPETGTFFDQISKKLGILQDIKVGDQDIDDKFLIQSDNPDKVVGFISSPQVRSTLRRLDYPIRLEFKDSALLYAGKPFEDERFSAEYLRETLASLKILAESYINLE